MKKLITCSLLACLVCLLPLARTASAAPTSGAAAGRPIAQTTATAPLAPAAGDARAYAARESASPALAEFRGGDGGLYIGGGAVTVLLLVIIILIIL
ncbi:MAG TPA: hypothetical protein VFH68_13450 [Polyangia bacterium]|nr:hypothetical protein [Polyangia bacterium]